MQRTKMRSQWKQLSM